MSLADFKNIEIVIPTISISVSSSPLYTKTFKENLQKQSNKENRREDFTRTSFFLRFFFFILFCFRKMTGWFFFLLSRTATARQPMTGGWDWLLRGLRLSWRWMRRRRRRRSGGGTPSAAWPPGSSDSLAPVSSAWRGNLWTQERTWGS